MPMCRKGSKALYSKGLPVISANLASLMEKSFSPLDSCWICRKCCVFSIGYRVTELRKMLKLRVVLTCKLMTCELFAGIKMRLPRARAPHE